MTEPTACCAARCPSLNAYCDSCDLLVGLEGLHVIEVEAGADRLSVTMESAPEVMGCRVCGVLAVSHGRRAVVLIDAPCFGRPVRVVWRKRTWTCLEPACPVGVFTEQDEQVAAPRALLTVRRAGGRSGSCAVSTRRYPGWPGSWARLAHGVGHDQAVAGSLTRSLCTAPARPGARTRSLSLDPRAP